MRSIYSAVTFSLLFSLSNAWAQVGDNTALNLVWHEASDDVFSRGFVLLAGVDIDQDGKGEFLTYEQDAGQKIIYLFEASGDNNYEIIWQHQFSDGTLGLAGGERGIMVTDIDNDGFQEIVVIVDSENPATANGFDAGHIFEWDGTDNGIPSTPTATFDPPRDAADRVALEYNSLATDLDNDGNIELVLTHRGGNGKLLTIIELTSSDLSGGVTMTVEFDEDFTLPGTPADTVRFQAKNTGFGITDVDQDGLKEIILFDDNTGFVRVYEGTGTDTYAFVNQWQPNPTGWVSGATIKSQIPEADFDNDGVKELYLSDTRGNSWIITPGGDVATMFDDVNWTLLHDWKAGNVFYESGEIRGSLIGDVDRDNKPDIYLAGNSFGSILDIEYDGGDVTSEDSYSFYVTAIDANDNVDGGHFARPVNIQLTDMDNDGGLEVVAIVPWSGTSPVANLLGLYVFEHEAGLLSMNLTKTWADPGDTVTVVVLISNPDSLDISAFEVDVHFDETIILFDTTSRDTSSIINGWLFEVNLNTDTVSVAAASDSAFNQSGNLYSITFIVSDSAKDDDESLLTFGDVTFNAGSPEVDSLMDGFIQVVVAGGDVDSNLTVQAFDASQILSFLSDTSSNLSLWSQLEADVSDTDVISSFDASLILQFLVGSITEFPSQADTTAPDPVAGSLAMLAQVGNIGNEIVVPILGVDLLSVYAGTFELIYDEQVLTFIGERTVSSTDGFLTISKAEDGNVTIYLAGAHKVEGSSTIIEAIFSLIREIDETTNITLSSAMLNESVFWDEGAVTEVNIVVGVDEEKSIPAQFELAQNYPNPFNPVTTIKYGLPVNSYVELRIYNLLGEEIVRMVQDTKSAGFHEFSWDASGFASGIYFYRLQAGDFVETRKMLLLK